MAYLIAPVLLTIFCLLTFFFFYPASISPAPYQTLKLPKLAGSLARNNLLQRIEKLGDGILRGPEAIAVADDGSIFTGTVDGHIYKISPSHDLTLVAKTGGRPLGMQFHPEGYLVVADIKQGLLKVSFDGSIETLTQGTPEEKVGFANDLDISREGVVYFSDSSKYPQPEYLLDLLEGRPYGKLLSYDLKTRQTKVLLRDLYFANGVALSHDQDFVLVTETYQHRITRYWIKGERAGTAEVFLDNLPGFPDNISWNGADRFWLALFSMRDFKSQMVMRSPWIRAQLAKLPVNLLPGPDRYGCVLSIGPTGEILSSYHDPTGRVLHATSSVKEHGGHLYVGSLEGRYIGKLPLS